MGIFKFICSDGEEKILTTENFFFFPLIKNELFFPSQ